MTAIINAHPWVNHPAKFSLQLLPIFAEALQGCNDVLDPFAGTGRIHLLRDLIDINTIGVEIEPEGAVMHPSTILGDATQLPFAPNTFDAICTSPVYGNRMSDHFKANDKSKRYTYRHSLPEDRPLHENNAGRLQWGSKYRSLHAKAWLEATRVLRREGIFVLNTKDHFRTQKKGNPPTRQYVSGWHVSTLCRLGMDLLYHIEVPTEGQRHGQNGDVRLDGEQIYVFRKSS